MRRGLWLGVALVAMLAIAPASAAAERPIVYAVVIDGLEGDRVDDGKAPFISSLLAERATYYRESRSVMIAETNPNHVAMMTGAYGNASGLPGNAFVLYAPLASEDSCQTTGPVDETKLPSVTSGESSGCLLAGDRLWFNQAAGEPGRPPHRRHPRQAQAGTHLRRAVTLEPPLGAVLLGRRRRLLLRPGSDEPADRLRDRRPNRHGRGAADDPRRNRAGEARGPTSRS